MFGVFWLTRVRVFGPPSSGILGENQKKGVVLEVIFS